MLVYFDNSSTTKVCQQSIDAAVNAMTECYGNPSSTHLLGRNAGKLLNEARQSVADVMGALPEEIYFTSGGTEADNWALRGAWQLMRHQGRRIISSAIEHDAVRNTLRQLELEGADVVMLEPESNGRITAEALEAAITDDTVLVSIMMVNNETGAMNDIAALSAALKRHCPKAIFHTDAVQGYLKVPFNTKTLGADLISVSSHKIHGSKGAGALYIRNGLRLPSIMYGGGQEGGRRPGTEAMPAIAGFGAAAKVGLKNFEENAEKMRALRSYTVQKVLETIPSAVIIGQGDAPHILNLSLPGYRSEVILNFLDAAGIAVSKGSACRKGARSHVLEAMKLPINVIDGAIRVSFSHFNTIEECRFFAETLADAASRLRHR